MTVKKTLVLGASPNPNRYSNIAIQKLRYYGHPVIAIGRREGVVENIKIHKEKEDHKEIDTVTVYMNDKNQKEFEDYILSLNPKRIIFNPGAENNVLALKAKEKGIEAIEACTLVMLSTGQY